MFKHSYSLEDINAESVVKGELKVGDVVSPIEDIVSPDKQYTLKSGEHYKVVKLLPPKYPGGFAVQYGTLTWGLWFGGGGGGERVRKVYFTDQEKIETTHDENLYFILSTLDKKERLPLEDLVKEVMETRMTIPSGKIKAVKTDLIRAIHDLHRLEFIEISKPMRGIPRYYRLTQKGKQFLYSNE